MMLHMVSRLSFRITPEAMPKFLSEWTNNFIGMNALVSNLVDSLVLLDNTLLITVSQLLSCLICSWLVCLIFMNRVIGIKVLVSTLVDSLFFSMDKSLFIAVSELLSCMICYQY
jgi:hypothetical protein